MGLPLFVAPTESDLPSKSARKNGTTSPSRSAIRRSRTDARQRREQLRTASVRIYGATTRPRLPRSNPDGDGFPPWVEAPDGAEPSRSNSSDMTSSRYQGPSLQEFREARQGQGHWLGAQSGLDLEHQVNTIFGLSWRGPTSAQREAEQQREAADEREAEERHWPDDPRPARESEEHYWPTDSRRARRTRFAAAYRDGDVYRDRDLARLLASDPALPYPQSSSSSALEPPSRAMASLGTRPSRPRYNARLLRTARDRHNPLSRGGAGMDGLGDRERSPSPEAWTTLLTTLTPDPQPPSASSSFASTAASQSQSAGASSNTSLSVLGPIDGVAVDAQCESDCSDSDEEEDGGDMPGRRRRGGHGRDEAARADRLGLGSLVSGREGLTRGTEPARAASASGRAGSTGAASSRRSAAMLGLGGATAQQEHWEEAMQQDEQQAGNESGAESDHSPWPRGSNAHGSGASGFASGGEEDWSGMQRIVRSLARREDIPDEWWAEVGLIRTLPQEATTMGQE